MTVRIVCNDPNATDTNPLTIAATGQQVTYGNEVEVEDSDLAAALLEQDIWVRPTTKAAKATKKEGS